MNNSLNALEHRNADHSILDLFLRRWSPRAMNGQALAQAELQRLFEAARWAPSTYNEQEWRFLYAHRDDEHWNEFYHLLADANQAWCTRAAVLIVVLSHKVFSKNGKPNPVHTFDAGLATQNLFLQATEMGLVAHGMAGFDREKTRNSLSIPDEYSLEAMIAIGHHGDAEDLPEDYRKLEKPSDRKPISKIAMSGKFGF